jgi:hypothetical protein
MFSSKALSGYLQKILFCMDFLPAEVRKAGCIIFGLLSWQLNLGTKITKRTDREEISNLNQN